MDTGKADEMLKSASAMMRALAEQLDACQTENNALREENGRLAREAEIAKAAAAGNVTLDKVACSKGLVTEFVDSMVSHHLLDGSAREKVASAIMESPDMALQVAMKAIKLSEWPEEPGHGIHKGASSAGSDDPYCARGEVWDRHFRQLDANY